MPEVKTDEVGNPLDDTSVFIVKRALIGSGWCCAPKHMSHEEVQLAVHRQCEPYLPSMHGEEVTPWTVVPREHTNPEWQSPGHCAEDENRQHWFMIGGLSGAFMMSLQDDRDGIPDDLPIQTAADYERANSNV